jgi:hypothetical protein
MHNPGQRVARLGDHASDAVFTQRIDGKVLFRASNAEVVLDCQRDP